METILSFSSMLLYPPLPSQNMRTYGSQPSEIAANRRYPAPSNASSSCGLKTDEADVCAFYLLVQVIINE